MAKAAKKKSKRKTRKETNMADKKRDLEDLEPSNLDEPSATESMTGKLQAEEPRTKETEKDVPTVSDISEGEVEGRWQQTYMLTLGDKKIPLSHVGPAKLDLNNPEVLKGLWEANKAAAVPVKEESENK